mmetsp:Transcript_55730/g.160110  ORF Transcript_55730/g.160110 Transcript_55730/m.160110 type:complete len:170 (-) Transcript_55730:847-1356(-)
MWVPWQQIVEGRSTRWGLQVHLSLLSRCSHFSHLVCSRRHMVGLTAFPEIHKISDHIENHNPTLMLALEADIKHVLGVAPGQAWMLLGAGRQTRLGKLRRRPHCHLPLNSMIAKLRAGRTQLAISHLAQCVKALRHLTGFEGHTFPGADLRVGARSVWFRRRSMQIGPA